MHRTHPTARVKPASPSCALPHLDQRSQYVPTMKRSCRRDRPFLRFLPQALTHCASQWRTNAAIASAPPCPELVIGSYFHEVLALGGELRHCFLVQQSLAAPGSSAHLRSQWLSRLPRNPCCPPCRLPYPWPAGASSASAGPAVSTLVLQQ